MTAEDGRGASIFKTLTTPSRFTGDWLGYSGNQGTHALLGVLSVGLICAATLALKADMPYKINVFLGVAFIYGVKEMVWDRWQGFDTVEDFMFLAVYGAGGTLLSFTQSKENTASVDFQPVQFIAVLLLFSVHMLSGIFIRKREAKNGSVH